MLEDGIITSEISEGQTINVSLSQNSKVSYIDVYWQDEVTLNLDLSLMYIKSGLQEIRDYMDNKAIPELKNYIVKEAEPIVSKVVVQVAEPSVNTYIENTVKPAVDVYVSDKTKILNDNYEQKVSDFNNNHAASIEAYNENAAEKIETVNSAAATATSQALLASEQAVIASTNAHETSINAANSQASANNAALSAKEAALFNFKKNITNCITEIPQDIKLELNNGTLTLKAGSKVYVPNGVGVFDEITVAADVILDSSLTSTYSNGDYLWFYNPILNKIQGGNNVYNQCQSGTYDGAQYCMFYDTTNNIIKYTTNSGTTWENGYSLPFTLTTLTNGTGVTSSDQVFNGFGYIGSTVFALPGVKGLIPNGRNSDGSLKNIELTLSSVTTTTIDSNWQRQTIFVYENGRIMWYPLEAGEIRYDEDKNIWIDTRQPHGYSLIMPLAHTMATDGKITSFSSKLQFRAVDYSDNSWISAQAMPSNKYIDLTLGASGSSYTAPANGWVVIGKRAGADHQYLYLINNTTSFSSGGFDTLPGFDTYASIPVRKNDVFAVAYAMTGDTFLFRFIYAEGEN